MRREWIAVLILLIDTAPTLGYVLDTADPTGHRHWDLVHPEVHIGANPSIPVSTNVVNPATKAVRFFIASDAYSTTNTAAELNAVRASFGQWQSVPGLIVKFEEGGLLASGVDVDPQDNTNVVFWAKHGTLVAGGRADIGGALGVTFFAAAADVSIGADIVLNGDPVKGYHWFTDINTVSTDTRAYFIEAVLTHEIGHFIGLEHAPMGAATMFFRGSSGLGTQAGLSIDEIAAGRALYPQPGVLASLGHIHGQVTADNAAVLGAAVFAENTSGGLIQGTVTKSDGSYDMTALPPGTYSVRAAPLDPTSAPSFLCRGQDILYPDYASAMTTFLPTEAVTLQVPAGSDQPQNIAVTSGGPAFRITSLRNPTTNPSSQTRGSSAMGLLPGQQNQIIGVYGANLPTSGSTLSITGDGLTITPIPSTSVFGGINLISVSVSVTTNATPGMRSLILRHGSDVAYANGFLDILSPTLDFNFDGLDDRFQRKYFPVYTAPQAGPGADPDGDGFSNSYEYYAGTDPTNPSSVPIVALKQVTLDAQGATVFWQSVPGGRYQLQRRPAFGPSTPWASIGSVTTASDFTAQAPDPSAKGSLDFYRVQILP